MIHLEGREASKALQADGEYIPRQAVIETIDKWHEDRGDIEDLIVKITYMPSVAIPSAEPKTGHWIMPQQDDGMSDPIYYQVRCSECGFDLDPQTWHQELHQYGADKYCPKCGCPMEIER